MEQHQHQQLLNIGSCVTTGCIYILAAAERKMTFACDGPKQGISAVIGALLVCEIYSDMDDVAHGLNVNMSRNPALWHHDTLSSCQG